MTECVNGVSTVGIRWSYQNWSSIGPEIGIFMTKGIFVHRALWVTLCSRFAVLKGYEGEEPNQFHTRRVVQHGDTARWMMMDICSSPVARRKSSTAVVRSFARGDGGGSDD